MEERERELERETDTSNHTQSPSIASRPHLSQGSPDFNLVLTRRDTHERGVTAVESSECRQLFVHLVARLAALLLEDDLIQKVPCGLAMLAASVRRRSTSTLVKGARRPTRADPLELPREAMQLMLSEGGDGGELEALEEVAVRFLGRLP